MPESWAARWADSWESGAVQRFNMTHAPAGSATGGQFASGGGSGGGSASKTHAAHVAHVAHVQHAATHPGAGSAAVAASARGAQKRALLGQAHADLLKAAGLERQLRVLKAQQAAAVKAAAHAKATAHHAAVVAHMSPAQKAAALKKHAAHKKAAAHHASLKSRISGLQAQITGLTDKAKALEAQAAKL